MSRDPSGGPGDGLLEEPEDYQAFVQSLIGRVEDRLVSKLDEDVQAEFANLVALLVEMPRKSVKESRIFFELAFDLLAAKEPNLSLVRSIRQELSNVNDRTSGGIVRYISFICGGTRLSAVISALITVILLSVLIVWVMITSHRALLQSAAGTSVLMSMLSDGSVELLIVAIHAAFVGGVVSIVARVQDFVDGNALSPPLVYISVLRKPFLAASFVVLVFSALKTGLVAFTGVDFTSPAAPYMAWVVGFLCGFSERFAQDFVMSAGGRFGA